MRAARQPRCKFRTAAATREGHGSRDARAPCTGAARQERHWYHASSEVRAAQQQRCGGSMAAARRATSVILRVHFGYTSVILRLYFRCTLDIYLGGISTRAPMAKLEVHLQYTLWLYVARTSAILFGCTSATPRIYFGYTSGILRLYFGYTSIILGCSLAIVLLHVHQTWRNASD